MRNAVLIIILEVVLLGCGAAYLHQKNPDGFNRVVTDVEQLVSSAISGSNPGTPGASQPPAAASTTAPSAAVPQVVVTPAAPAWNPPTVMPAQPNWTWTTVAGRVYTNVKVLSADRDSVMITYDGGGERVPLAYLPPDLQKLFHVPVAPSAAAPAPAGPQPAAPVSVPAAAPSTSAAPGGTAAVGSLVAGHLVRCAGNGFQPADDSVLAPVRYVAIYYSAQWCAPGHAFTPKLVQFYNSFKPSHPDFDLIFVSEDHDETQMLDHMREMAMPWLAVDYSQLQHGESLKGPGIQSYINTTLPDLVLVDSTGAVLSDSARKGEDAGPEAVLADIPSLVK